MVIEGKCFCGVVCFEVVDIYEIDVCYCNMCCNWNGGLFVGVDICGQVKFQLDEILIWYVSFDWVKCGFCNQCGSLLFYKFNEQDDFWLISVGVFELLVGFSIGKEIFVDEKLDYYNFLGDQLCYIGLEFFVMI